jgi:hypothetical protein
VTQITSETTLVDKRPYLPIHIIPFLLILTVLPFAGLLIIDPATGSAGLVLARLIWRLTPMPLWFGAVGFVVFWLLTLRYLWSSR